MRTPANGDVSLFEVERKRQLPDGPGEILARLGELGYRGSSPVTETDTYFSRPDVDYLATVECLRVRQRDGFAEITYKPPSDAATHGSGDVIAKRETNVRLAGGAVADDAIGLLTAVGMVELVTVRKSRMVYRHPGHGDVLVAVDEIAGLGWFAETEVTGPDPEDARKVLEAAEELLGAGAYPVVSRPYRDLLLDRPSC
jgi:adenylate cyclase class 2